MNNLINIILNIIYVYVMYPKYLAFPKNPASSISLYQKKKLERILKIAVNKVPFYKQYKDKINFRNFTMQELTKLPIISKEDIRATPDLFIREDVDQNKLRWKSTSGSSGKPFRVPKSYFSDAIEVILGYRAWSMGKYKYRIRSRAICLRSFCPNEGDPVWKRDWIRNFWYLSPYHINQENLPEYIEIIKRSKSKVLKGYPSSIYLFTLLLKKNKIKLHQIRTIITSSEDMIDQYSRVIRSYWKCDVLDWYGQNERTVTVQQCEFNSYHNNDDYGFIELYKNNIIATSINNNIMPLIRYKTGDLAEPVDGKDVICECGNNMTIPFYKVKGRADDIIYKKGLDPIPTINFYNLFEKFLDVRQFQIIQEQDLSIKVYVSEINKLDEQQLKKLKKGVSDRVGDLPIKIHIVKEVLRDKNTDKVKLIKSNVKV